MQLDEFIEWKKNWDEYVNNPDNWKIHDYEEEEKNNCRLLRIAEEIKKKYGVK